MKKEFGKGTKYSTGKIRARDHEDVYQEGDTGCYMR